MTPEQRKQLEQWAKSQPNPPQEPPEPGGRGGDAGRSRETPDPRQASGSTGGPEAGSGAASTPGTPREPSPPTRTKLLDARPPTPEQRRADARESVMAEWLSQGDKRSGDRAQSADDIIRQAQRGAERAIEDRTVPSRYDRLLNRYFRRLPEAVKPSAPAPADAPPAADAP